MAPGTYREPASGPPVRVIVHRATNMGTRLLVFAIALFMLPAFVAGALSSLSEVELVCRDEVCRIDDRNAILPDETTAVRAEEITDVRVDEKKERRSTRYVVVLVTTRGEIPLDPPSRPRSDVDALAARLEAFRAEPKREVVARTLHHRSFAGSLFMLGLSAVPLLFLWLVTLHTRVEVDVARGVVRVVRRGYPFPRDVRELALDEVRYAWTEQDRDFHRIVLVLGSGEHVPLQTFKGKDDRASLRTAEAINQALQVP